jgi:hypothetical protein
MNKLILFDKSPIASPRALAIAIIAAIGIVLLSFTSLAKAADKPDPELEKQIWSSLCLQNPIPANSQADLDAKRLMIQRFQIPPDAIILEFWSRSVFFDGHGEAVGAYITWETHSSDRLRGHVSSRGYDLLNQVITAQTDFDF